MTEMTTDDEFERIERKSKLAKLAKLAISQLAISHNHVIEEVVRAMCERKKEKK